MPGYHRTSVLAYKSTSYKHTSLPAPEPELKAKKHWLNVSTDTMHHTCEPNLAYNCVTVTLMEGTSACSPLFGNSILSATPNFDVAEMEVWTFRRVASVIGPLL